MKKLLCLMLAAVMLATMSVTAFADYTTSVTYDITSGNAVVKTTGTAGAGSEVTQILYTGASYEAGDILYITQETAASDGTFGFDYQVKAEDINGLDSMMSIVGSDEGPVDFTSTTESITELAIDKRTVTVKNVDMYKDITVYVTENPEAAVTIPRGTQKTITVAYGSQLTFNVGSTNYEVITSGGEPQDYTTATFTGYVMGDGTYEIRTNADEVADMTAWAAGSGAYDDIMVWDAADVILANYAAAEGSYATGDAGLLDDVTTDAKELSVLSKIANATGEYEYGIMFVAEAVETLDATTAGVKILPALGNTDGVWAIKAIDKVGETLTTATVCTYVKVGDTYRCGDAKTVYVVTDAE